MPSSRSRPRVYAQPPARRPTTLTSNHRRSRSLPHTPTRTSLGQLDFDNVVNELRKGRGLTSILRDRRTYVGESTRRGDQDLVNRSDSDNQDQDEDSAEDEDSVDDEDSVRDAEDSELVEDSVHDDGQDEQSIVSPYKSPPWSFATGRGVWGADTTDIRNTPTNIPRRGQISGRLTSASIVEPATVSPTLATTTNGHLPRLTLHYLNKTLLSSLPTKRPILTSSPCLACGLE